MCIIQKRNAISIEFYISDDKELYKKLFERKAEIEKAVDCSFDWRELPERKASRIIIEKNADFTDKNQWNLQFDWFMDIAVKIKREFKKYI